MSTAFVSLVVEKVLRRMVDLDRYYHLGLWWPQRTADCLHDLSLMHGSGDLLSLSTELLASDRTVLMEHCVRVAGLPADRPDLLSETAVPLLDRKLVASGRFLINRRSVQVAYASRLRLAWNDAPTLGRREGDVYGGEQGSGQDPGTFHVSKEHRRLLIVKQGGKRGYGFAEDPELKVSVFLHVRHAPLGMVFHPGQHLSAIVVSTGQGLQARAIRPA